MAHLKKISGTGHLAKSMNAKHLVLGCGACTQYQAYYCPISDEPPRLAKVWVRAEDIPSFPFYFTGLLGPFAPCGCFFVDETSPCVSGNTEADVTHVIADCNAPECEGCFYCTETPAALDVTFGGVTLCPCEADGLIIGEISGDINRTFRLNRVDAYGCVWTGWADDFTMATREGFDDGLPQDCDRPQSGCPVPIEITATRSGTHWLVQASTPFWIAVTLFESDDEELDCAAGPTFDNDLTGSCTSFIRGTGGTVTITPAVIDCDSHCAGYATGYSDYFLAESCPDCINVEVTYFSTFRLFRLFRTGCNSASDDGLATLACVGDKWVLRIDSTSLGNPDDGVAEWQANRQAACPTPVQCGWALTGWAAADESSPAPSLGPQSGDWSCAGIGPDDCDACCDTISVTISGTGDADLDGVLDLSSIGGCTWSGNITSDAESACDGPFWSKFATVTPITDTNRFLLAVQLVRGYSHTTADEGGSREACYNCSASVLAEYVIDRQVGGCPGELADDMNVVCRKFNCMIVDSDQIGRDEPVRFDPIYHDAPATPTVTISYSDCPP